MSDRDSQPAEPLVEPLTRREREILALLAQGLSAPEIAEKFSLAVSSVKWHIQQLYGKLGVNSKQKALVRAAELGLLAAQPVSAAPGPIQPIPQAQPAPTPRHNLPVQVTRFFGRENEIAQLGERLAEHRLVTLTGSGGVGKTRLSLQAAEAVLADSPDGVWLVELAPLTDAALVPQHVASTLGVRDEPGRPVLETLTAYLRERQLLLVLDNCEHLLEACARLADALLRACPRLRLLASSREPLGIPGEAVFPIPSLPFPDPDQALSPEGIAGYASVRLFLDRARMVLPNFHLAAHNAPAVTRICQRLDGIPLAIEMAAARVNILSAEQLAGRLDDVFRVLTGGSRTALPRQQTLRATVDWSYKLLNDDERRLLQRLSVFAGGWTLAAAEAVCADPRGEGIEAGQVLDLLGALVVKSIVIADRPPGEEPRYHLLEAVRQYAREKLQDTEDGARLRTRHRDYFLSFAKTGHEKRNTQERADWVPKLSAEYDNLRLALEWSFSDLSDVEAGPRLVLLLEFEAGFAHQELLDWHMRGLALCRSRADIPASLHVALLEGAAANNALNDPPTALELATEAVEISRTMGPIGKETLMWSLFHLAAFLMTDIEEPDRAVAPLAEADAILQGLAPDRYGPEDGVRVRAYFAYQRAELANRQGRHLDAIVHAGESIRLYEASGSRWFASKPYTRLGIAHLHLGAHQEAREHFMVALNLNREIRGWEVAYNLRWLAAVDIDEGNLERALDYCQESITAAELIPDRNITASNLGLLAAISAKQGQPLRAARLAGASAAMWARQKRKPWEDSSLDTLLPGWRDGPEYSAINDAFIVGQAMSAEQAVALALENEDHQP